MFNHELELFLAPWWWAYERKDQYKRHKPTGHINQTILLKNHLKKHILYWILNYNYSKVWVEKLSPFLTAYNFLEMASISHCFLHTRVFSLRRVHLARFAVDLASSLNLSWPYCVPSSRGIMGRRRSSSAVSPKLANNIYAL